MCIRDRASLGQDEAIGATIQQPGTHRFFQHLNSAGYGAVFDPQSPRCRIEPPPAFSFTPGWAMRCMNMISRRIFMKRRMKQQHGGTVQSNLTAAAARREPVVVSGGWLDTGNSLFNSPFPSHPSRTV